ncbi:hypothetical protein ABPG72_009436 [Tetrahymena utriculariae]
MLKKGFEYIKNDLNICIVIENIQEIQKIKYLLLTQEQEIIFNFIPKPIITPSSKLQQINERSFMDEELGVDNLHQFQQNNTQNQDQPTFVTRMSYNTLGAYQVIKALFISLIISINKNYDSIFQILNYLIALIKIQKDFV